MCILYSLLDHRELTVHKKMFMVSIFFSTALQDIEPSQLLLFIQSFGIPMKSMTSLLACLDKSVISDPGQLEESVEDKQYMAQLIEIQHMRGAKGGEVFYKLLKQGDLASNLGTVNFSEYCKTCLKQTDFAL